MQNQFIPRATSSLVTWLHYLEHLHPQVIELGLDRVRAVANKLNLQTPAPRVFTVAGTNGKGTTCATLESVLIAAGYRVGVYSSPHFLRYAERVRIQGEELSESAHCESFALLEAGRGDISLTYFEYGTLSALQLFKEAKLDVVILEVGLGGRLDATNIIDASVSVVTSIALDHTDWLGSDRESIGREKAGIFRAGKPAVIGEPNMPQSIATVAQEKQSDLYRRDVNWHFSTDIGCWHWGALEAGKEVNSLNNLPFPNVPLANAATALAALYYSDLNIPEAALRYGLQRSVLPGRFQIVSESPRLILDVAHNPHAATYLAEYLVEQPRSNGKVRVVIGMLKDKDIASTLACLLPQVDEWYCAPLGVSRGASVTELAMHLSQAHLFDDVESAWKQAMQEAAPQDIVIVCGSFHTVAHVMNAMDAGKTSGK